MENRAAKSVSRLGGWAVSWGVLWQKKIRSDNIYYVEQVWRVMTRQTLNSQSSLS